MKKSADLTKGNIWKVLLLYSLPLFGSAFVQQLYSLVDLLVVGNFAREGALAVDAIGNASVIINILLAFALAANGGCSVIVAKYYGMRNNKKVRETVNTAFVSYAVLCAAVMALGFGFSALSLRALGVHDMYFDDCIEYLYIYIGSLPFVFLYNLACGVCSAVGDSKTPFIFLAASSVLNVALDLLFVRVLHMDVAGAAWATFISQAISCVLTAIVLFKKLKKISSDKKPRLFVRSILKDITATSLPIFLQQSFITVGNFFVTRCINGLDSTGDAITGFTTAFKFVCTATMSMVSMTNGLSNFAAQNKAAGEHARIKKGYFVMLVYTMVISLVFLAVFVSCPQALTKLFIHRDKLTPAAMNYSVSFLTIVSCFLPAVCVKILSDGAVRGCGGNVGFAVSTIIDLVARVILVYALVGAGWGFDGVCWAWPIGWSVSSVLAVAFWIFQLKKLNAPQPAFRSAASEESEVSNEAAAVCPNDDSSDNDARQSRNASIDISDADK